MKKYIVVNTCTITAEGERQCRQELRKLKKQHPDFHLIITGCAGQLHGGLFASMPEVDFVIGNENKLKDDVYLKIDKYFQDLANGQPVNKNAIQESIYADCIPENADLKCKDDFELIENFSDRSRAFVPIHTGCNHFCAFCIVPFTRGKFCSYAPEYIVNQIKKLNENGYHEVVLTGIDITDFGKDIRGQNAVDTLGKLCKSIFKNTQIERLRLSSVDVAEIDTDIMDLVVNEPRFMPYFHISLQSGDDNVLRRMRRRHRAKDVYDFCNKVVQFRPDAAFGSDIITGFPGETDNEFANSLKMVENAPISYVHAFPYSRREKTLAYLMDDNVPKQVKKERLHKLIDAGEKNLRRLYKSMDGRSWRVIIEHNGIARAENFAQIVIDDTFEPGTLAEIKVAFDGEKLVARRGASLAAERSPSGARADGARRCQTARAWPRAAQHQNIDNKKSSQTKHINMSKFVFSGIQPSGVLHLGNYIGAILNWKKMVKNADKDDKFLFMIADLHSLTSCKKPELIRQNIYELLATYLACGIEPSDNLHFFIQSSIPEHCQLCWLLTTICPLGQLERMTQFKDKKGKLGTDEINAGLLYYPLLMAADILLYRATHVPVGEDQTQHMEFCRDMVDKFENKFGERAKGIFIKPEAIIDKTSKRIMSLGDGTKKMSKSIGEDKDRIMLTDTDDQIAKKIKTAKTDSITGIYFDKDARPEVSNLINIMSALSGRPVEEISEQYKNSGTKVFKDDLTEIIINEIAPIREKFLEVKKDTKLLEKIVDEGDEYAKKLAEEMMIKIYSDEK